MARGRFISESVAKDMRLNSLSVEATLVYLMTVPHLDRDGLIEGDTEVLYGTVCPKRRIFIDRIGEFIQEWVQVGLVTIYDTDDGAVLWFKGFAKNQLGLRYDRETPSRLPPPPGHIATKDGVIPIPQEPKKSEPEDPPKIPPKPIDTPDLSTDDSIRQNAGELPESDSEGVAQLEDQVEVEVQDQSSPLPPSQPQPKTDDDELGAVFSCWMDNIPGMMTPILKDEIIELVDECKAHSVIHGITVAVEQNKRFFKYVASCARNHATGREPPGRKHSPSQLSEAEKSKIITRAKIAQASIKTAEKLKGYIEPQWVQDIEIAKGYGL